MAFLGRRERFSGDEITGWRNRLRVHRLAVATSVMASNPALAINLVDEVHLSKPGAV
jgi:hypothetical protein